jgi:hypothetical protein
MGAAFFEKICYNLRKEKKTAQNERRRERTAVRAHGCAGAFYEIKLAKGGKFWGSE